jgi:hypothetical protein
LYLTNPSRNQYVSCYGQLIPAVGCRFDSVFGSICYQSC